GPLPALGVAGAAIATVSVQIAILAVYHAGARGIEAGEDLGPPPPSTRADLAEVMRYGLPVGGHLFAEIGIFGLATVLAAHMGKLPAAADSVGVNLASVTV